jgi:HK97 family phage major capsid protein
MALYYATDELLMDAGAMEGVLAQAFAEEIRFLLDDAIFRGDGAGKPMGVLSAGCLVTQAAESGQAADTILYENVVKMFNRLPFWSRAKAAWYINQECEPQIETMVMSIGTGGAMSPVAVEYLTKGTIKGLPVIPIEHCSKLGDVGDIVLADMSQYILAEKGGMQTASSMHVKFAYDEMAFRITYRVDGQPVRASAITPYKATAGSTLSPFVTLAAR